MTNDRKEYFKKYYIENRDKIINNSKINYQKTKIKPKEIKLCPDKVVGLVISKKPVTVTFD